MPYILDKGPYLSVLDDRLANLSTRAQALQRLRSGADLADLFGFDSQNLGPDNKQPGERKDHLRAHWFGMKKNANGAWAKQPGHFPTGWWSLYQGDPEAILRTAMERAIEVSFGLDPGDPAPADPATAKRRWSMETFWICQGPWFQCWILWKKHNRGATAGHVTIIITTPATVEQPAQDGLPAQPAYPLTSQITRPTANGAIQPSSNYGEIPPKSSTPYKQGVWVVGHEDYKANVELTTVGTPLGKMTWPALGWKVSKPRVVCVAPSFWEGGVKDAGFGYVP